MRTYQRLGLKARVTLWAAIAIAVVGVAGTAMGLSTVQDDMRRTAIDAQTALVENIAADLDRQIEQRRSALALTAAVLGPLQLRDAVALNDHLASRPVVQGLFDVMFTTDRSGAIVFDAPHLPGRVGRSVADRDYFKEVMANGRPVVSQPIAGKTTHEPNIVFAAPLRNHAGETTGLICGIVYLTRPNFISALADVRIGKTGYVAVLSKGPQPLIVMHAHRDRIMSDAPPASANPHLHRALSGFEGTVEGVNSVGLEALFSYRSLRHVPWVVTTAYPTAEAYAEMRGTLRRIAWMAVLLMLLGGVGIWLLTRHLLAPLDQLREAMVAARESNQPVTADLSRGARELREVAEAYNALMQHTQEVAVALGESERRLRDIADNVPALIGYFDCDERCRFANKTAMRLQGSVLNTLEGKTLREAVGDDSYVQQEPAIRQALAGKKARMEGLIVRQGREMHFEGHFVPDFAEDGSVRGFYTMSMDITPQKVAEAQRAEGERRLRTIANNLPVLIAYVDDQERIEFANETYREWLGVDPAACLGKKLDALGSGRLHDTRQRHLRQALAGERVSFDVQIHREGHTRHLHYVYVPDARPDGRVVGVYALSTDVTALKTVEQQLNLLARVDSLTSLPNRRAFDERLAEAVARSRRNERPMALMYLDIDHFKQINDTCGHGVGDEVLKEFARRLQACVRVTDTVARLAGDEFVVILEGLKSADEAAQVATKIGDTVRVPFMLGEQMLHITSSIGVAFYEGGDMQADDVVSKADAALYEAKRGGRNRYALSRW